MQVGYESWLGASGLKAFITSSGLACQRNDEGTAWYVFAVDGGIVHETRLFKEDPPSAEQADFESTFASLTGRALTGVLAYRDKTTVTPATSDGKPIVMPSFFPGGVYFYVTGAGDDCAASPATRGNGQAFALASDEAGTQEVEFQFCDWLYLSGGGIMCDGAAIGDFISMKLYAPATVVTAGGGAGNCNVVSGIIVPAGNGAYNVDLATATLIPAYNEETGVASGYWDWSEPDTGRGTITASAVPGSGKWHLIPASVDLVRFVNRLQLCGSRSLVIETNIKPKKIIPHWKFKVSAVNGGHAGLCVSWYLRTGRAKTL
jgi:hypothetical protein